MNVIIRTASVQVLRPVSAVSSLEVWGYYVSEELCHGAPYDLELLAPEPPPAPAAPAPAPAPAPRRVITAGYMLVFISSPTFWKTRIKLGKR